MGIGKVDRMSPAVLKPPKTPGRRCDRFPDLSVQKLARLLGISRTQTSRILAGDSQPSLETAVMMSKALGVPVEAIHGWRRNK